MQTVFFLPWLQVRIMGFIVELEPGVYLAPWRGDPGRTLVKDSAKVFPGQPAAYRALARVFEIRAFSNPRVLERQAYDI